MITELNDYQQEAIKTIKEMELKETNKYCAMKLCEEAGEVTSLIAKHYYHGKPFERDNLKKEMGDVLWYIAGMAHANGFTLSEIATANIEKLRERHGEKYNHEFYKE
jgi:NTP pyrophosphatase (non-canonical NTP hydrolase)